MASKPLLDCLHTEGYYNLTEINGRLCGLHRFAFTVGLVVGLDYFGYEGRYCFERESDALESLLTWDGKQHPSGEWLKFKGKYEGEYLDMANPQKILSPWR